MVDSEPESTPTSQLAAVGATKTWSRPTLNSLNLALEPGVACWWRPSKVLPRCTPCGAFLGRCCDHRAGVEERFVPGTPRQITTVSLMWVRGGKVFMCVCLFVI